MLNLAKFVKGDSPMSSVAVGSSPIQNILLAKTIVKKRAGESFVATSLPGHLLHYVIRGRVRQQCNGRAYELKAGSLLWYHEDEWVQGEVLEAPWEFYSINFIAPTLPPPPFESRSFQFKRSMVKNLFASMVTVWEDDECSETLRLLRLHGKLLQILEQLSAQSPQPFAMDGTAKLWWELETRIRQNIDQPLSLTVLEKWSGCSIATVARSSQNAVGQPPMKRIKQIRLSLARGLVQRSELSFSQIALQVGYFRLHEFSRDYKKMYGLSPSEERNTGLKL
jgi:AraC-like DNA-binding protein